MIASVLALASAANPGPPPVDVLSQIASLVNSAHPTSGNLKFTGASVVGNTLTIEVSAIAAQSLTDDETGGRSVRDEVCKVPVLRAVMQRQSATIRMIFSAPNWTLPLEVAVVAADCGPASGVVPPTSASSNRTPVANPPASIRKPPIAAKGSAARIEIKGVPLGISFDEFRKLPHPDGTPAQVICTGEKFAANGDADEPYEVRVHNDVEIAVGVRKCVWISVDEHTYGENNVRLAYGKVGRLTLAGTEFGTNEYSFSFVADPVDRVLKLYRFQAITNRNAWDTVVQGWTAKYGVPKISHGTLQNGVGNRVDQTTALWTKGFGSIATINPTVDMRTMAIVIADARLSTVLETARAKRAAAPNAL